MYVCANIQVFICGCEKLWKKSWKFHISIDFHGHRIIPLQNDILFLLK